MFLLIAPARFSNAFDDGGIGHPAGFADRQRPLSSLMTPKHVRRQDGR
jgi:hypothetical protein